MFYSEYHLIFWQLASYSYLVWKFYPVIETIIQVMKFETSKKYTKVCMQVFTDHEPVTL